MSSRSIAAYVDLTKPPSEGTILTDKDFAPFTVC
jgi:hypothetical protein